MDHKGQGLSMNTIILAALGLIVLVVLVAVFTGETGEFRLGLEEIRSSCNSQCSAGGYSGGEFKDRCGEGETSLLHVQGTGDNADKTCCCRTGQG